MRRLLLVVAVAVAAASIAAQDPPPPTPTLAPQLAPTNTPLPPTPVPTSTPLPDVRGQLPGTGAIDQILLAARNDIEVLANATLGAAQRPEGWSGLYDVANPEMAFQARLDLEILADQLEISRPAAWAGVQPTSAYGIARDIRADLELLADAVVDVSVRPPNWIGDAPIMRCSRSTQALVTLLESRGLFSPAASPASPSYCQDLMLEASLFTEVNLLDQTNVTPTPPVTATPDPQATVAIVGASVNGFFDRGATQRAGIIPAGTVVQPVARSYAQFSRMILVRGDGFELFLDYEDTTMDVPQFEILGDVNAIQVNTVCNADWCGAVSD